MTRVGFCHLICVFSLLLCQADICGSPHQTANKAAFKVNMLNIPVCCDCGTVCSHTFLGQCLRHALPSACQHSTVKGPKREYWLGVSGLPMVYLPSSAVCNLKGGADKFSWTASLWILTFFPLLSLSTTRTSIQEGSSCCETLGPASSVHHLSALSEKTATKTEVVLDSFSLYPSACFGYLAKHQTFSLKSFCICAALQWNLHFY